ncbi:DUF1972 domain-containing protein [Shewanella fodinae]|uniref:Glycosyltransferase involved in cell wall biosynthesis n=1 Tax=Shewanella fodinae TaxID=552357 RepID=A0A4R2F286_9GAMM|nr:DUF1972 domain-containing protein [Shewanella fodinae]TCN77398.1 glycosyltransferase involved in cell wall biosynthesis [Shewanella fodinae]
MKDIRVAVIGTVGLPACYGGFESLVENLVEGGSENIFYTVYASAKSYTTLLDEYKGAKIIYIPFAANGIQSIPYDVISLINSIFLKPDIVLILGVSGCIFLPIFRFLFRGKIITNIDGLEWKRQKWGNFAKTFLKLSERFAVKYSDIVIADNQAITDYVKDEYNVIAETIAYGGDHALGNKGSVKYKSCKPFFLSICRIEPENNVQMILEAFAIKSDINLKFVGNWNNSEYGRFLKTKYSSFPNIDIIDSIYDVSELYFLRSQCVGYIHGHSAGGTNPSLVEAMHFGKAVFAFDCSFNRYTTEDKCLYFLSSKELANAINNFSSDSDVGDAMLEIANRRYTWDVVRTQYEKEYCSE